MRPVVTVLLAVVTVLGAGEAFGARSAGGQLRVAFPSQADGNSSVAVEFSLPGRAAAVDGRILFDTRAAEVVGLAPAGGGTALAPQPVAGGVAFGAYGLNSAGRQRTTLRVLVAPLAAGQVQMRLVVDAAADRVGNRLTLAQRSAVGTLRFARGAQSFAAPADRGGPQPLRAAGPTRDVVEDGRLAVTDIDVVRAGWELGRLNGSTCDTARLEDADANGDGCVDIVDIQAVVAAHGQRSAAPVGSAVFEGIDTRFTASAAGLPPQPVAALAAVGDTFVVTSTADRPDAVNGDGLCADSDGRCTLRAAITESNWQAGDNRIEFNLSGTAPVRIQLTSDPMSIVQDRTGSLVIDGYSQPGSRVNTAEHGSNAIPGVELRGTGSNPRGVGLRITSANNVVRGILFNAHYSGVFLDTADAHHNQIVGNWFGFTPSGGLDSYSGRAAIHLNSGANHNEVGTPALADRNVTRGTKSVYLYGPGTVANLVRNNVMCMTPSGASTAQCSTGVDHDFGPQSNVIGGTGANEHNVIGRTSLNCVEYSHGWDPNGDNHSLYQVKNNRTVGNWLGFRVDGRYDASYRCAQSNPGSGDNGNGVNVYDGSNFNIVERNWIASVWDGVQTMSPNATGNIIRNNVIGQSPLGEPAPLARYGVVVRGSSKTHFVEGNTIRNAGVYGIGLIQKDVLWVRLSQNVISDMSGPALFFAVDPNDPSKGADNLIPAPAITSASTWRVAGTAVAGATVEVYRASRDAGDMGLPVEFLGSAAAVSDGTWSVGVTLAEGERVTALQIHPSGNTSNLATNAAVALQAPPDPPSAAFSWSQQPGTLTLDFADQSTGSPTTWEWTFGDGGSSTEQNPTHSYSAPGDYTVALTAGNAGGSDTTSATVSVAAPPPADTIAADSFGRTLTNTWGSADVGGPYTLQTNSANYDVANGLGTMVLPAAGANRSAQLAVAAHDVDIRFRVAVDKDVAGASSFAYAIARANGSNAYRPRLILHANGSVSVHATRLVDGSESALGAAVTVNGLAQQPNTFLWLRAAVTGAEPTTIRVKAWADGQPEPEGWQFAASDSTAALQGVGTLGLRTYAGSATTNAPLTFSFDDLLVTEGEPPPPPPAGEVAADEFARTVSGGWGSADTGGSYTIQGSAANYSVDAGVGSMTLPSAGTTRSALLESASAGDVDMVFRVAADKVAAGRNFFVYAVARRNGNSEYRPRLIFHSDGSISVGASVVVSGSESSLGSSVVSGLAQSAGSFIWLRARVEGSGSTTIGVKAWADGSAEPADWQFRATDATTALQSAGSVGVRAYVSGGATVAPLQLSFDDYSVTAVE